MADDIQRNLSLVRFVLQMTFEDSLQMSLKVFFLWCCSADTSGVVFDTRSKMVMWQGGTTERMKEKVRRGSDAESAVESVQIG